MGSSRLSDLIEPPVDAPGDDEFVIEGPTEDPDELAGKKTKSSSDKRNDVPESSSSEKKKKDKKKKKKRSSSS